MKMPNGKSLNYKTLLVFAPLLVLIGALGFVIPEEAALTSGAPAYNIFHLVFGAFGILLLLFKNQNSIRAFNIGFGLIDLYQAFAAFTNLFPIRHFQWTRTDDVLHIVVGAALVLIGVFGDRRSRGK